jgi:hypothetical protein
MMSSQFPVGDRDRLKHLAAPMKTLEPAIRSDLR